MYFTHRLTENGYKGGSAVILGKSTNPEVLRPTQLYVGTDSSPGSDLGKAKTDFHMVV